MNRVCLTKDGKFIEMQSGGRVERLPRDQKERDEKIPIFETDDDYTKYLSACDALEAMRLNTLKQNALNQKYKESEIEVKWINEKEWATMQTELNKPASEQIAELKREALIQAKIREQAIAALKAEGKL